MTMHGTTQKLLSSLSNHILYILRCFYKKVKVDSNQAATAGAKNEARTEKNDVSLMTKAGWTQKPGRPSC